jgi:hypothetical protein
MCDSWREQQLVDPWWINVHIIQDLLLLSPLPAALEGGFDIFISVLTPQRKHNPTKDGFGVSGRRIVMPEQAGIRKNSQLALA